MLEKGTSGAEELLVRGRTAKDLGINRFRKVRLIIRFPRNALDSRIWRPRVHGSESQKTGATSLVSFLHPTLFRSFLPSIDHDGSRSATECLLE